jgi:Ran GTPase-activating protein (RanGAP) involved in mRNA processing and transport
VKRPFQKQANRVPGLYQQTKWAAHRKLSLSHVRFGSGVTLLHIAMAKPEVETAKWLLDYDVRDELYNVTDLDGNVAFMGAVEELSTLLKQIEETPQGEFRRTLQTRRSKFARVMLSKQVLSRRVPWDKHSFARLDDLARDLTLAFNKLPFRARNRVCQWRKHAPAIQAFLTQMYLGSHPAVDLKQEYLGPELGMHFAVALQTNRSVVFADMPMSNMRPEAAKTAASAIGDKIERAAVTALDLSGNQIGAKAAIMLAKAIKRTKCLKYLDLAGNNIGKEAGKRIATSLRKWDNTVQCVNVAQNQLGFDAGNAFATTIKRRGSTIRGMNLSDNRLGKETGMAVAAALWKKSCHITYLDVSCNQLGNEAGKAFALALKRNKILVALWLGNNRIGEEAGLLLAKALRVNTTLTFLDLRENKLGSPFGSMFSAVLKRNETLTEVNLQTNSFRYEIGVQLAEAFAINHTVTAFDLTDNELNAEAGDVLAAGLKDPDCVWTSVNLSGNEVDEGGGKALAQALRVNKTMTRLEMSRNLMGQHAGKAIGKALKVHDSNLQTMIFRGCNLGPKGAESISLALEDNMRLTILDLEKNGFGEAGMKSLAMALESNTSITSINLAENKLGPEGGKMVAAALVMNSTLTSINIRGNAIGPAAGEQIAAELEVNNNIIFIDLEDNNLDPWFGRRIADSMFTNSVLHTVILAHNKLGHERKDAPAPVQAGRAIVEVLPRRTCGVTYLDMGYNRYEERRGEERRGSGMNIVNNKYHTQYYTTLHCHMPYILRVPHPILIDIQNYHHTTPTN